MANNLRVTLYRLEQLPDTVSGIPQFAQAVAIRNKVIPVTDIRAIDSVNVLGGADLGKFPWLYSKITYRQAGVEQEAYAMQTVLQLQAAWNA